MPRAAALSGSPFPVRVQVMFRTVDVPLWLLILIVGFAAVTFASHFLFPSVRWFFRRRAQRFVDRLNARLARPIEPFKLARRTDMIERLSYDPQVMEAVAEEAARTGTREDVVFERARRYAREIVPAFSATAYFGVAIRAARALSTFLYDVRPGRDAAARLHEIDPGATIVFVMNHRSNMDYVLVTYLAGRESALSYAVGEWARVVPLRQLIRAMGGYFIRRRSAGDLYRRVLARYVQLATRGGVTQAVFPEGGLSVSGGLSEPKLGILDYISRAEGARDTVFVPVALNYDRVLEDRILTEAGRKGQRRFRASVPTIAGFVLRYLGARLTGRAGRFGTAAVRFGAPLSLTAHREAHGQDAARLGTALMGRIAGAVPVLSVPLLASAVANGAEDPVAEARALAERLRAGGANVIPGADASETLEASLANLRRRGIVGADGRAAQPVLIDFYAASIAHLMPKAERATEPGRALPRAS